MLTMFNNGKDESVLLRKTHADHLIYAALAANEHVPEFKSVLERLSTLAKEQSDFWREKVGDTGNSVPTRVPPVALYRVMRTLLGVTLTTKYIFGRRAERMDMYKSYCTTCTVDDDYASIEQFIDEMNSVIENIEEERVKFFSNIILGFNDALIELTGVLVGFSFAMRDPTLIMIGGIITGISASMSMAASAFLQARHEKGRSPTKAAFFTGTSYFVISALLVLPFALFESIFTALAAMFAIVVVLIMGVSFYSAILLERRYAPQLLEVLALSLGVSTVAFFIGQALNALIG